MGRFILAACAAAVVLFPLRAAAQEPAHDSPRVTIAIDNQTLVGDTVLKPGSYRFQCRHVDGKTFLVVTSVDSSKEIVRVPCTQATLADKIENSELRAKVNADGTRVLQSVRIKGESIEHRLAN